MDEATGVVSGGLVNCYEDFSLIHQLACNIDPTKFNRL